MHSAVLNQAPGSPSERRTRVPSLRGMARLQPSLVALLSALVAGMPGLAFGGDSNPDASTPIPFATEIHPILEAHCFPCHGPEKQRADLRLDRRDTAFKGGESGPAITPGNASDSLLLKRVASQDPAVRMPPKGEPLSEVEIQKLRSWIEAGAVWPADAPGGAPDDATHWSFQPVQRPTIPASNPAAHAPGSQGSPIDALVVERLTAAGLTLSPEAPRTTLIRRLYLVMLGLPPTPEEVDAFLADPDPDAFEQLVDRVLADPRYGERWARHWLDVIRFAETNGFETNRERPTAWRFRDYVIAAFNQDLPFDQFVREQIAGDALGADVATGFLVGGPVDIVGSPDPVLTAQQRADELDDMVNTTGTAFLGLTLGCARCHNHKFDPIEQREYYALTAVFSGVRHGERPLPPPPETTNALAQVSAEIADLEHRLARFLPKTASTVATRRPPVSARSNTELFKPVEARWVRFTILASNSGEPCLDELEVYAGDRNVALARHGTRASASGSLQGFAIHKLEHLNDGQVGNSHSWISSENGKGWVQLEFPRPERIDRIVWGRDRKGEYSDRLTTAYRIETALDPGAWRVAASSDDREPLTQGNTKPAVPYRFEDWPQAEADQGRGWLSQLEAARARKESLAKPPMAYAGTFSAPPATHRLHRGDPMQKREPVTPATLQLFQPIAMPADEPEQSRRLRLADWLASPGNPLTPRVLVNRLWQHHFGVGLVDTPNDFGRNGSRPTHPELLDWLASELIAHGWSVKAIQRQILLSATWRQVSSPNPAALRIDAANRLLWRFPPRRLEAEAIRDAVLHLSGSLSTARGGPSFHLLEVERENVYHYHPKDDFGPAEYRRMVYAYKVRMEQDDVFGAFDCPDGSLVVPRRSASTTALQALNLFNSRFVTQQAKILADRLLHEAGPDPARQITRAWQLAFNRIPSPPEAREALALANEHGLTAVARALFNANEFLFIP